MGDSGIILLKLKTFATLEPRPSSELTLFYVITVYNVIKFDILAKRCVWNYTWCANKPLLGHNFLNQISVFPFFVLVK